MNSASMQLLFWSPRILGILFAGFLAIFAFDVFEEGRSFWGSVTAFLVHLLPSALVLVALAIAWRWEWAGCILFMGMGALCLLPFWGNGPDALTYLIMTAPMFLTGLLFCLHWHFTSEPGNAT